MVERVSVFDTPARPLLNWAAPQTPRQGGSAPLTNPRWVHQVEVVGFEPTSVRGKHISGERPPTVVKKGICF